MGAINVVVEKWNSGQRYTLGIPEFGLVTFARTVQEGDDQLRDMVASNARVVKRLFARGLDAGLHHQEAALLRKAEHIFRHQHDIKNLFSHIFK